MEWVGEELEQGEKTESEAGIKVEHKFLVIPDI